MNHTKLFDSIIKIFREGLISFCEDKSAEISTVLDVLAEKNAKLVEEFDKIQEENADSEQILALSRDFQSDKSAYFTQIFSSINTPLFGWNLEDFNATADELLKSLPPKKILRQQRERFHPVFGDSRLVKTAKFFKRLFYGISTFPRLTWNGILHLFGKQTPKIPYWQYRLPYRLLTQRFIKIILIKHLDVCISEYSKGLVLILKSALDKEQVSNQQLIDYCFGKTVASDAKPDILFDLQEEKSRLSQLKKKFEKEVKAVFLDQSEEFEKQTRIAGTIEQPTFSIKYHTRKYLREHYKKTLYKNNIGWGNTAFSLFEDWKIDQEIFKLITQIRIELNTLERIFNAQAADIVTYLDKSLFKIREIKERLLERLSRPNADTVIEVKNEISGLEKELVKKSVNPAVELIVKQNFIGIINQFEIKIAGFVSEISDKKWLTKLTSYDVPLKSSDLNSFSPHELLSFKYIPELTSACSTVKADNIRLVESFKQDISNISGIIAFNLSTVLESKDFDQRKNEETKQLISEGFDRAVNKLVEIKNSLKKYGIELKEDLEKSVNQFIDSTVSLTDNENAFELRLAATKAKAIRRTLDTRLIVRDKAKLGFVKSIQKYNELKKHYTEFIIPWKRRLGIHDQNTFMATELTDFLSDALHKINKLPIVYQQLYRIQALTEMNLFTGRKEEAAKLQKAYQSWKDGKYAPTVIIGEKWSGHTTLINYFIEKQSQNSQVIYENKVINISSQQEFLDSWKIILKTDNINTIDDLITLINTEHKNKIIVFENIQNYYLRTIKGFDCINLFIKLISKTYHSVFWLCTANVYAWEYLNRTIEISGYFGYLIKMSAFTDDELRQLIMKKNNISGYKIIFLPAKKNLESKKFTVLDENEKQTYLQNQFFKRLNDFAKGNISLALSYWLLSTKNISEGSIEIDYFESPDFSFISELNSEKVFIIYLIIMHDGLTLDHLGQVLKKPAEKLNLLVIMLLDDGILIEHDDWFEVNPLIYRHAINMLKMQNLIY